ncbi:MgtC/SapB family protein, partial [Streptococcus suis]
AILCLASCTISILQIQSVDILVDVVKQNSALASIISMDITRYGAQVISGVGFLGAGIIVFRERKVSGLTTAVMMWNVTIIGLVIGMGF